jgi:murein DD-endopeptidase MepM/ murein hydrolase activator NlpD
MHYAILALALSITNTLVGEEPVLRMPFPAGTVVLCTQGNLSPTNNSHYYLNARHALDFTNGKKDQLIVAAASGTVALAYNQAREEKDGSGFGNQVKISHGDGFMTFYAHLAKVLVVEGQKVRAGDAIGIMGDTGMTGHVIHLHFSFHHNDGLENTGVSKTIPVKAMACIDMDGNKKSELISSLQFINPRNTKAKPHCYGSENGTNTEIILGSPPTKLLQKLNHEYRLLQQVSKKTLS